MKIQINSVFGSALFEGDFACLADAVTAAVKQGANLTGAILARANLARADLTGANLAHAYLTDANLTGANLTGANLTDKQASELYSRHTILPEGDLIGYKKLRDGVIARLLIPAAAKRVGGLAGRKCRAEYAQVLEGAGFSHYDAGFEYRVGATVRPTQAFDPSVIDACRSGIHFFITRAEAEAYEP
jgi:uncharacterized protein YjbI with pentapeptide repeats